MKAAARSGLPAVVRVLLNALDKAPPPKSNHVAEDVTVDPAAVEELIEANDAAAVAVEDVAAAGVEHTADAIDAAANGTSESVRDDASEACSTAPDATSSYMSSEPVEVSESVGKQSSQVSAPFGRRTPRVFQPFINPDLRPASLRLHRYYLARRIEQLRAEREE